MHVAAFAAENDTSKYTNRYRTTQKRIGRYGCAHTKLAGAELKFMHCQNLSAGMLSLAKHLRNVTVWLQTQVRAEAERKSAFWVPAKQEQRMPPRLDDHRTALSDLPPPTRNTMALDRELGSPTTTALEEDLPLPIGVDDSSPHALRTHAKSTFIIRASTGGPPGRRGDGLRGGGALLACWSSIPSSSPGLPPGRAAAGRVAAR